MIALWGVTLISRAIPASAPPVFQQFEIDGLALAFTSVLSILTGLAFGLVPALQASRPDLVSSLKEGGRSLSTGRGRQRFQDLLVTAEIAVALLLLVSAALCLRSYIKITGDGPGFNPKGILTMQVSLPEARYREEGVSRAFFHRLEEQVRALPGVRHAGMSNPLFGGSQDYFLLEGQPPRPPGAESWTEVMVANSDYFRAMEIPLIQGRHFDERDREGAPAVAIVDRRFAETYWPGESPIGKRIMRGNDPASGKPWLEVVGVVESVRRYGEFFDLNTRVQLYQPYSQHPARFANLVVKSDSAPEAVTAAIRGEVLKIDPDQPVFNIRTMEQYLADRLQPRRLSFVLLAVFAGVAILLAAVGVYALMAYSVSRRTHEIGVRVAMGAGTKDVFRLVMGRGLRLTSAGVATGLLLAFLTAPLMRGLLFGVSSRDPLVFVSLPLALALVALAATVLPALRAARITPTDALRQE
jgi:putative ABC transport system permease protein